MSEQEERGPRMYSAVTDKVGFGKYREMTLEELYAQDVNYLRWAVNSEAVDKDCFMTLFNETDTTLDKKKIYLDSVVWFGKFKGKTFGEVCSEDREYAEWVLGEDGFLEYAEGDDPSNAVAAQEVSNPPPVSQPAPSLPPTV